MFDVTCGAPLFGDSHLLCVCAVVAVQSRYKIQHNTYHSLTLRVAISSMKGKLNKGYQGQEQEKHRGEREREREFIFSSFPFQALHHAANPRLRLTYACCPFEYCPSRELEKT